MDSLAAKHQSSATSSPGMLCLLAAQHVMVLFSGILLIPVMLANMHGLSQLETHHLIFTTVACSGAATLFQLFRGKHFGLGAPMFMGTSGAYLGCVHEAFELGGIALMAGMVLASSPLQVMFSYSIRFMRHILTPTVGGVVIMLAMVGLLKDSVAIWGSTGTNTGMEAAVDIATGGATIGVMLMVEWFGGRKLRPWNLPLGMLAGYAISLADGVGQIPNLATTPWFGIPSGPWPGITFAFNDPAHWTLAFTFGLAVLATSVKYTGDAMVLQRVATPDKRKVDYDALQGGLYANSAGMVLAGLAGGMPSSSHSPNIPLMEMTGVATRRVGFIAASMLLTISLSPKMLLLIISLPESVVGGVGVVLVGHLFSSGMQLVAADINHRNGFIAGLSLCTGLIASSGNFFPAAFPDYMEPLVRNGVALGGLVAVIATLITTLGTHRAVRISMLPTMENLIRFKSDLASNAVRLRIEGKTAGFLELACEEVYLYMREECRGNEFCGPVTFLLRRHDNRITVEVTSGTAFASEADEMASREIESPEAMSEGALNTLGLALLGRIASNVGHATIGGHTYINFTLPVSDG